MPPKSSTKPKKAETPESSPQKAAKATPKKASPKKKEAPAPLKRLETGEGPSAPVDISFEGLAIEAKVSENGGFTHQLKLEAPSSFTLIKTFVFTEGPYQGQQAIIIRPAKALPFLELSKEVRARIYRFYFAPKGVVGESIVLDSKRANKDNPNKDIYAKTYADGSKNRVGLLAVNKEIYDDAIKIFYAHSLKLESTSALLDFLSQTPNSVRPLLHSLEVKGYVKTNSRNALCCLAEAKNIVRLRFESGVCSDGDPTKAARAFFGDAQKFLEAIGASRGVKDAGVDLLEFGKQALTYKDEKKNAKPWADTLVKEFKDNLRGKLK